MPDDKFYITVAIDYANAEPHVGHAYEKVTADALARYHRLKGRQVFYLMGNDEHSANVERRARELDLDPQEYSNRMARVFQDSWDLLDIKRDRFVQTSSPEHKEAVTRFITRLYENGHIYAGKYTGWYCVSCEAFYAEDDLVDGKCPVHQVPVDHIEEDNYFFRLSAFSDRLRDHIAQNPGFIQPSSRAREMLNVLQDGLRDISISRNKSGWGIPLPWDSQQVVYVWFDALLSYISGIGYDGDQDLFSQLWPADVHLIGKDITRFHTLIWPAMLMGVGLPLPRCVFAHGFLMLEGQKMSKSSGHVLLPEGLVESFGSDPVRYYLVAGMPFGPDGDFTMEGFVRKVNDDLSNDLGNLLSRTTAMIDRFAGGKVPRPDLSLDDGLLKEKASAACQLFESRMESLELDTAFRAIWELVHAANKYIEDQAPWSLAKKSGDEGQLRTVLYNLAESLRVLAILVSPVLVRAPARMRDQLGLSESENTLWSDTAWGGLVPGTAINRGEPLFPRLDLPATDKSEPVEKPEMPAIGIDEFKKVDLRVCRVMEAKQIKGSDRLLLVTVDDGGESRTVVAGLAGHYQPEELHGRMVVVVANLKPARIFGHLSQGMILAAEDGDRLELLTLTGDVTEGSPVS